MLTPPTHLIPWILWGVQDWKGAAQEGTAQRAVATTTNGVIGVGPRKLPAPEFVLDRFMLDPKEAAALQTQHDVTLHELMQLLVAPNALLKRPPTSAFPVV
ncbi:g7701 [Coccomyxa elongata]